MAKTTEDPKAKAAAAKKKADVARQANDPRRQTTAPKKAVTEKSKFEATDWDKKARIVEAAPGTKIAENNPAMKTAQHVYAKEKIMNKAIDPSYTATDRNSEARLKEVAARLKADAAANSTFKNSTYNTLSGKFGK